MRAPNARAHSYCAMPGLDLEAVQVHGVYDPEEHYARTLCDAFTYMTADQTKEPPIVNEVTDSTFPGGGYNPGGPPPRRDCHGATGVARACR